MGSNNMYGCRYYNCYCYCYCYCDDNNDNDNSDDSDDSENRILKRHTCMDKSRA